MPIYVLDEMRRIVYCNPACAAWTGIQAAGLIGQRCDYHSRDEGGGPPAVAAGLCPPPEAFAGRHERGVVACRSSNGKLIHRRAEFVPLGRDPLGCAGVVAVLDGVDLDDGQLPLPADGEPTAGDLHNRIRAFRQACRGRYTIERLIGDSPAIRRVRDQVALAVEGRARVSIIGPLGSGREHIARTIHYNDQQNTAGPLVPLSCSLLDAELLQTTITAFVRRCAELETERPAALLLLEADRLPPDAQMELAGFLNIPEFELHLIATARRSLTDYAEQGRYRIDVACALSTLVIRLPALAERATDVPPLAQMFLEELNAAGRKQLSGFTPEALDQLAGYPWPGNADELAGMVRQCHQRAEGPTIGVSDLPERIRLAAAAFARPAEENIVLDELLADIESKVIRRALERARGNKSKAARLIGMTRAKLHRRLAQLGLHEPGVDEGPP